MKLNKPYTREQFTELVIYANENGMQINHYAEYVEAVVATISFEELKNQQLEILKVARDIEEQTYFVYGDNRFDSDPISTQRIGIASQQALAAKLANIEFAINWTDYDDHDVTLDADGLLNLSSALAVHSTTVHVKYRERKEEVEALIDDTEENREALKKIVWK